MLNFSQIHSEYATAIKREFASDRSLTVGASDVGQCARKVFFSKNEGDKVQGINRDLDYVDGWGATARGSIYETHWWEPALRAWAKQVGAQLLFAGAEQRTLTDGFLSATPDGLLADLPAGALVHLGIPAIETEVAVECKTIDPRVKLDEPKPEHVFQVQVQLGLIRELTNHRPNYGVISYTDTSFWNEVKEFVVTFDPKVFDAGRRRAIDIMTATDAFAMKPEGKIAGGKECEYCPFVSACRGVQVAAIPDADIGADPELAAQLVSMALEAKSFGRDAEEAEKSEKALKEEIKALLSAHGIRRVAAGGVSVNWMPVKGRPSYDMVGIREAAAAAGVDLSKFETAGDPTDRLDIRVKKSTEATN